jgi:carbonic anhydrase
MNESEQEPIRSFLVERYRNFLADAFPKFKAHFADIANDQKPRVLFIGCSDSRVVPNVLLSGIPGDIFECRVVGNIVPAYGAAFGGVSATLEYAITVLKVQAVIICGHSDCGAMKALQSSERYDALTAISSWLHHSDAAKRITEQEVGERTVDEMVTMLTRENVIAQLENAQTHPAVAAARRRGFELFGWVYDIKSGRIDCYDERTRQFVPLETIDHT